MAACWPVACQVSVMASPGLMVCGLMLNEVMPTASALACGGTVGVARDGVGSAVLPGAAVRVSVGKGVELAWLGGGVALAGWLVAGSGVRLAAGVLLGGGA